MARKSKKTGKILPAESEGKEIAWKAGIYARLSVDSNNWKNESIDTQIQLAKEYISQQEDIELIDCYKDLGKTGTNFNREGFHRMMSDVRRKKINCIVVKDLSRFGRDYIETGNYIEKIFPFMKVRFVAVTDNYDSARIVGDNDRLSMNLKNIVNELYAKDIAQRVKTAKKMKQEMGSYTGGVPPYGYCAEKIEDKKVLIPEMVTKDIVNWIFEKYAGGSTYKEIAEELYKRKIQRPTAYRATGEIYCPEDKILQYWPYDTIKWILTNPTYIGMLFQARTCGKACQQRRRHEVDEKDDVTIVEHTHEPIVSEELFYKVSQRFDRQKKYANNLGFSKKIPLIEDIFKDMVYCGACGHCMNRNSAIKTLSSGDRIRSYYYYCPNSKIDNSNCKSQRISLKDLQKVVKAALEKEFSISKICEGDWWKVNDKEVEKKRDIMRKQKRRYLQEQEEIVLAESKWYLKYRERQLSYEAFLDEKKKAEKKLEELKKLVEELEKQDQQMMKKTDEIKQFIRRFISKECLASNAQQTENVVWQVVDGEDTVLKSELVKCLMKRINIGLEHQVEIIFNYTQSGV